MSMIVAHVVINEGNEPNSMILTQAIANNSRGVTCWNLVLGLSPCPNRNSEILLAHV
jgi:hypothetical protein